MRWFAGRSSPHQRENGQSGQLINVYARISSGGLQLTDIHPVRRQREMTRSTSTVSPALVVALGGLVLAVHIALIYTYAYERLWWDGAVQLYRAILADGFAIPQYRYIHLLTQSIPVLLMRFADLNTVIHGYSLSLALPFLAAVAVTVALRDLRGLLLAASLIFCVSTFTFFWGISEIRISIGLSVILLAVLCRAQGRYWGVAVLFLVLPIYFAAHPISLVVYSWVGVYYFLFMLDRSSNPLGLFAPEGRHRLHLLLLFCLVALAAMLLRYATLNLRELGILQHADPRMAGLLDGEPAFVRWLYFPAMLLTYSRLQIVVIAAAIWYLFCRPERWLAVFATISSLGWILIVYIVVPIGGHYYMEHLLQPAVFFALAPACYALPERIIVPDHRATPFTVPRIFFGALIILTMVGCGRVIALGEELSGTRAQISELTGQAIEQDIHRAHIPEALAQKIIGPNIKYLPVYSLLYTSAELNRSTVFWPDGVSVPNWAYREPQHGGDAAKRFFSLPQSIDWEPLSLPSSGSDPGPAAGVGPRHPVGSDSAEPTS